MPEFLAQQIVAYIINIIIVIIILIVIFINNIISFGNIGMVKLMQKCFIL